MILRPQLVALTALLFLPFTAFAAPVPKDEASSGPQVMLRVQSAEELAKRATDFLKAALPPELFKLAFEQVGKLDVTQIPIIDPTKPAGFYASFHPSILRGDFTGTQIVLMAPVKGEKETIEFLEKRGLPMQFKDGLYTIPVVNATFSLYARFKDGYAYVGVGTETAVSEASLFAPKDFFAQKESAAAVLSLRLDRIPAEIKDLASPILTFMPEWLKGNLPRELNFAEKPLGELFILLGRRAKQLSSEGRELAVRADLNPKTVALDLEIAVDGKAKSNLADAISAYKPSENRFASMITSEAAAYVVTKFPLHTEELRRGFSDLSKEIAKQALLDAPKQAEGRAFIETFFEALTKTVQSGNMDTALVFNGPSKEGTYQAVGGMLFQNAKAVEKTFIAQIKKAAPKEVQDIIQWDAHKIGDAVVHEADLTKLLDEATKKVFGKMPKISVSFTEEGIFVAFGSDNLAALKSAISAKRGKQPVLDMKVFNKKFHVMLKNLGVDQNIGGWMEAMFLNQETMTILKIDVEGGEKLKVKISMGIAIPGMLGSFARSTAPADFKPVMGVIRD